VLELLGPKGISQFIIKLTQGVSNFQSGLVFNYALVMLIGITVLILGTA
jgi:hypothetical protein